MKIEDELIGSIILNQDRLAEVKPIISVNDFESAINGKIYAIMLDMQKSKIHIDEVTLSEKLSRITKSKTKTEINGLIMELMAICGCSSNALYYAKLVAEKSVNNKIGHIFNETAEKINSGNIEEINMDEVKDKIEALRNQSVTELTQSLKQVIQADSDTDQEFVSLGYNKLDSVHSGGLVGELTILAGSPSTGKSQFGINLLLKAQKGGMPAKTLLICQEMSAKEIQDRILGAITKIHFNAIKGIRRGKAPESTFEKYGDTYIAALETLSKLPMKIHATGRLSIAELEAVVSKNIKDVDLIMIDYLQQIKKVDNKQSDYEKINEVSAYCMEMSVKHGVPIIGLSQFNREGYKDAEKRPTIANLRESGQLEQDAANIWLLWRNRKVQGPEVELELEVAKNRNGQTATILFNYTMDSGFIKERVVQ